jgi:hypothetical protein
MLLSFLLLLLAFVPGPAFAMKGYLTDIISTYSDQTRFDTCGDCHASWTGAKARGDLAVNYKMWDYTGSTGMSTALLKIDMYNIGISNDWRVANQTSNAPYPFTGSMDKDGDGYIPLIFRTERAGTALAMTDICSSCSKGGGNTGAFITPPAGWDMDDNNATQGNVPWNWNSVANQTTLATYFSNDAAAPTPITDLRLDMVWIDGPGGGVMPAHAIPMTWTAPADDDPAAPGAVEITVPVHHYDIRYTTELVLNNYNAGFAASGRLCSAVEELTGSSACQIRNPAHWHTLFYVSDCGVNSGAGQENLTPYGVLALSNACASGLVGWNRGEGTPLMRALYEGGFEDEVSGLSAPAYSTGPPYGPAAPGSTETYLLQQVTDFASHSYADTGIFVYTDKHDLVALTRPNYVAADTVYWVLATSDDSTVQACVETAGNERSTTVGAGNFCVPSAGDAVIWPGPWTEAGSATGFHSYDDPGFQPHGNIIAIKSGGGARGGAAITNISPTALDVGASPVLLTINGIGFTDNAWKVALVDTAGTVVSAATPTVGTDRSLTVSMGLAGLAGDYTVEIREDNATTDGKTAAAWVNAVNVASTDPGTIILDTGGLFSVAEDAGPGVVTVLRNGGTFGPASVTLNTSDGTATLADSDYTAVTGQVVNWGDGVGGVQTVNIPVTTDTVPESDETVNIALSGATGAVLGSPATGTLTITNDDANPGSVEFSVGNFTVGENGVTATINVNRVTGFDGVISVDYSVTDGTAVTTEVDNTNGLRDFEPTASTLIWEGGTGDANQSFQVTINDDTIQEADETIILTLSGPTGGATITGSNPATLTIIDDDTPASLQFNPASYNYDENTGTATLTVSRTGSLTNAVSVSFYTTDAGAVTTGSAALGTRDFEPVLSGAQSVSWTGGDGADKTITITVNEDTVDELDSENFLVTLDAATLTGGAILGASTQATVTLTDNDSVLQFSSPTFSVDETGPSVTISATRTDLSGTYPGNVSVQYATTDGTAVTTGTVGAGTLDFNPITLGPTLNWVAGDSINTTQIFTVTINNDTVLEGAESFTIDLANAAGDANGQAAIGAQGTTTVNIVDDESPGQVRFVSATYTHIEDDPTTSQVTIGVERVGGSTGTARVTYATVEAGSTAVITGPTDNSTGEYDYVPKTNTLTWGPGVTGVQTFTITVNNDDIIEDPDEFLNLALSNPLVDAAPYAALITGTGAQATATLTIQDSFGVLQIDSLAINIAEDGVDGVAPTTTATVTVTRVGGSNGAASVSYISADGTAVTTEADNTNGLRDFVPLNALLNWTDRDGTPTKSFTITVNNDALDEANETFAVNLSGESGAWLHPTDTSTTVTINDSVGTIQFDSATYSVNEDGGVDAIITATRVGGSNGIATAAYATANGTALAPGDYTASSGTLIWANDVSGSKTFAVPVINDDIDEVNETVALSLSGFTVAHAGAQTAATLTIIDSFGTLQFNAPTYSVAEDGGTNATITVTRIGGTNGAISVDYATADGAVNPATAGTDYTAASGTLNWADGVATAKTFVIPVLDDALAEADETVDIALSNPTGGAQLGAQNTATLTIIDSVGTIQFDSATYSVNEDGGVDATITVTRVGGSNGAASVSYASADGAVNPAAAGSDYTAVSGVLNWATGISGSKTFTIPVINDSIDEDPDETVDLTLSGFVGANEGTQSTATLTIIDSFGKLQFNSSTYTVAEDGSGSATITVSRVGGTNGAISVDYATADNTAVAPGDYTAASGTLSWVDADAASKTFTVTIINDATYENPDEIVDLSLTNPSGGAQLGTQSAATLTITDSAGDIQFSAPTYSVNEDGGADAVITVSRVGGSRGAASVNYASSDGSATSADYTGVSGILNWLDNDAADKSINIPVTNDTLVEPGGETVNLTLSSFTGAREGTQSNALLTIIDSVGRIEYVAAPYTVTEDTAGAVTITARRVEGSGGQLDVPYTTSDGTAATLDSDYVAASGTLTWLDGVIGNKSFTVTVNSDRNIEPDEALNLTLSPPAQAPLVTTLTIQNDDATGSLQLAATSYNVDENGVSVTLSVTRTGGDVGLVSIDYATLDGTAITTGVTDNSTGEYDYVPATNTVTWADFDTAAKTIIISINNDLIIEGAESFALNLSNAAGGATLGSPSTATVNITDDDAAGTVQFSAPTYSVNEDGGSSASITVTRAGGNAGRIDINYQTTGTGTATVTDDYTAQSGTFTWLSGDTTVRTITIPVANDTIDEDPDETVDLTLSNPLYETVSDPSVLGAQGSATLTIIDSYGRLQFSSPSYQVTEDGGTDAVITVTRSGGSNQALTVDYAAADNTATDGLDYTAVIGTLSWADGDIADKAFNVPIINDAVIESPDEIVDLSISNTQVNVQPVAFVLGAPSSAALTIVDSAGNVQFSAPTYSVAEDGGIAATITVTRVGGINGAITVDYATLDGTAQAALDYTAVSGTLSWVSGDGTSKTISVPVLDDALDENPDETYAITLSNPTLNTIPEPAVLGAPASATVTIIDSVGALQFDSPTYTVNEDGGVAATISVSRVGGSNGAASVNYASADAAVNPAAAGVDYTGVSGTLSWADGIGGSKTFTVPVINDDIAENPDETVDLTLSGFTGARVGTQSTATLTIIDSFGALQFSSSTYSVAEDGSGLATITVNRVGGSNGAISVDYATANNTAVAPGDYTATTGILTWADGNSTAKTFTIPITNDSVDEADELVNISLSNPLGGAQLGAQSTATLTIIDSLGDIQFSSATYSIAEDGIGFATITVSRAGGTNGTVSINYTTADGAANPAAAGVDYTAASGSLSWADGDGSSKSFNVPIVNDSIDENLDETIDLSLSGRVGGRQGIPYAATLTIIDSVGTLQFDSTTYSVDEDGVGYATINVVRGGGSNGAASVNYLASDGTATVAGGDYPATSGTLSWVDGDVLPKSFTVAINNDSIDESIETINLSLNTFVGALEGIQSAATLSINDSRGDIQFSAPSYTVSEAGISAVITVSRAGGSSGAAAVNYATSNITATAGVDYTARSGTFNWASGDRTDRTFTIPVVSDTAIEGDETVGLTLTGITGARIGAPVATTLTITDSPGTLQLSNAVYSVYENGVGSVTLSVTRTGGSGGAASIDYATGDGTAVSTGIDNSLGLRDYESKSGTLTWANGDSTSRNITITINPDLVIEGAETFSLALTNVTGASLVSPASATVTVNDSPGLLQFKTAAYSVSEDGAGVATITVARVEGSGGAASVSYASLDADAATTATAGSDYTSVSGLLNWANNDAADKTFTITIASDAVIENPDEQVRLALSGANGAALGSPTQAQLTIIDSAGTIQLANPVYSVDETGVSLNITVLRPGGDNGAAFVNYATSDGTATAGADYTATSGVVNWVDGNSVAQIITIPLLDDSLVEGDESFTFSLNSAGGATLGSPNVASITIVEDDIAGNLEFTAASYSVNEDGAGVATIAVRRSLGSIGAVNVSYATSDGTAVAGADYAATSGVLSWADGDALDKTFNIIINPDALIEAGGELINLSLSSATNGATLNLGASAQQTAILNIIDSAGSLRFTAAGYNANESSGTAIINVERVGGSGGAVSADYATADGSAVAGADYTAAAGTLSWAADDTTMRSFTLTLNNDLLIEADETVNLTLTNAQGGAVLGTPSTATLTILSEDGTGTVQLSSSGYSVFENIGMVTITVSRVGGSVGAVAVYFQTAADSGGANPATANDDYTAILPTRIDWLDGDASDKTFDVIIPNDVNFEADETFLVMLLNPVSTTISAPASAAVTISNDDSATPTSLTINPGWSMISVPTDLLGQNSTASLFGDDFGNVPAVYRRVSSEVPGSFTGTYVITDTVSPGQGYFVINDRTVPVTLDDQYNSAQTIDPFEMTLAIGGSMLGNPYATDLDLLLDGRVCNFTLTGCTVSGDWVNWATAAANGWVTGSIYSYDTDTATYALKNPADGTMIMVPWEAYWFRTESTSVLKLRFYDQVTPP